MTRSTCYILCLATLVLMTSAQPLLGSPPLCVKDFCSDRRSGNYRHCDPQQCLKGVYISCSNGYVYVMPCPADLYFHERTNKCDYTPDCPEIAVPAIPITELEK